MSRAVRAAAIAAIAGFAVLAPIRMAEGAPKTRFAVVPAAVTPEEARAAAGALPEVPPAPAPAVESPFPLSHVAVRWVGSEDAAVDLRLAGPDGKWGPWRPMHVNHDLEDGDGGPIISELIRAGGATQYQLRARGDARNVELLAIDTIHGPRTRKLATGAAAGAAEKDEEDAEKDSPSRHATAEDSSSEGSPSEDPPARKAQAEEPPSDGGEDRGPSAAKPSSTTTTRASSTTTTTVKAKPKVPQPNVITRAEWGADESIRKNDQKYAPIHKLFVHHTVTSPDGQDPDPAATVRAIYAYHVQGNGWDDIGYNFLIDGDGRVYEGRWARDYAAGEEPTGEDLNDNGVVGAHVLNHNAGSAGVALLGDFSNGQPTSAAREALVKFMAWKADRHGIDVLAKDPFTSSDGVVSTFPNLAGHRDAGQTACPGNQMYPLLPDVREEVSRYVTAVTGPTTGYWTATADGRVIPFGSAKALGSMAGTVLNGSIVGMARTVSGKGYWLLGSDGGVFSFGDAEFYGSTGAIKLNKPVVGMAATPTGKGYWFVATDGGIFNYGDARFYGSTGAMKLNKPIVGMAPTPSGKGYWLVASDGGIFAFGDAKFHGSTGAMTLNKPVVSMAPNPTGAGYWLLASDGGLFAFGVPYFGSVAAAKPEKYPGAVQIRATRTGKGYFIADANGGIAIFGDAKFLGADTSQRPPGAAVDLVLAP